MESALNDLKMTLNATWPKVPHLCWTTTHDAQISFRFALKSLVFQIIEFFYFSTGYSGEFEILKKKKEKIIKNRNRKISKIPNIVLWRPLGRKFMESLKTIGCDL